METATTEPTAEWNQDTYSVNVDSLNLNDGLYEFLFELIDAAGCRGLMHGAAQVSEKHCNFLINTGGATAAEIEALGEDVRARVRAATGIELDWEIRRIGRAA